MRRAARTDANQATIIRQLRAIPGVTVAITSRLGEGFPDLCVGYRGRNVLLEIKMPKEVLTPAEKDWHHAWTGHVAIVTTFDEAWREIINPKKE